MGTWPRLKHLSCGLLLVGAACSAPQDPPLPDYLAEAGADESTPDAGPAEVAPAPVSRAPGLHIALAPVKGADQIQVAMTLNLDSDGLQRFSLGQLEAKRLVDLKVSDLDGPLKPAVKAHQGGVLVTLAKRPRPPVQLEYRVVSESFSVERPFAPALDPNRLSAGGESLLLLPDAFEQQPVPVTVAIDAKRLASPARAASCLGAGAKRELELSMSALRRCSFIAGPIGVARFRAPEGNDEAAWMGYSAFDPRMVAAETAAFRSAARQVFGDDRAQPFTLLFVVDSRAKGRFGVARRTASALVHVGSTQPYDATVRLAVNHQIIKQWVGSTLWVGPAEGPRRAESYWFSEGVTRHLARELSLRFGLITPDESAQEVERWLALVTTSRLKALSLEKLAAAARAPGTRDQASSLLIARGALYALGLQTELARAATGVDAKLVAEKKLNLDLLLKSLYAQAVKSRAALPLSAWTDALKHALGPAGVARFENEIVQGKTARLPNNALGKCFVGRMARYPQFDLGFVMRDLNGKRTLQSVRPGGPAFKAGLRAGESIAMVQFKEGRVDVAVKLKVQRGSEIVPLSYAPLGIPLPGQGFTRLKHIPDSDCLK